MQEDYLLCQDVMLMPYKKFALTEGKLFHAQWQYSGRLQR
jgi:hypothetical protein